MLLNVFPLDVEAIWWSISSLCLYALISLLSVFACLWVCGLVITSQFILLKIYVHPALPAPPQALHFSIVVGMLYISNPHHLSPVGPAEDEIGPFPHSVCSVETRLWSLEHCSLALTWLGQGRGSDTEISRWSWRVGYLCQTVASRWAAPCWAE